MQIEFTDSVLREDLINFKSISWFRGWGCELAERKVSYYPGRRRGKTKKRERQKWEIHYW